MGEILQISLHRANVYLDRYKGNFYARRDSDVMLCLLHSLGNFEEQIVST